jgi:hypothetical protein
MYPSLIWFGLLLVSVLAVYVMRRRPWYVLAWFTVLAIVGWLMPPFDRYVYCGAVQSSSTTSSVPPTAFKCVEYTVPDPYSFIEKLFSSLIFIFALVIGLYMVLKENVLRRLW